ncbi:MAG: transglutaminase domain-containing protein [Planctomycetes bacterium]|nr:transglutaminase domain-containing protein [Planctomycetota bacterium]
MHSSCSLPTNRKSKIQNRTWFLLGALFLLAPASTWAEDVLVYENFYLVKMYGQVCGRMHFKTTKVSEAGKPVRYVSIDEQKTMMKRGNDTITTEENGTNVEDETGKPVSFENVSKQSKEATVRKGLVKDGVIEMTMITAGDTKDMKIPYKGTFLFPYGEQLLRKQKGFAVGTAYTYGLFLAEIGDVKEAQVKVLKNEKLALGSDKEPQDYHVLQLTGIAPGLTITFWCADDGYWRKFTLDVNDTEMVVCAKEDWEKPIDPPRIDAMKKNSVDPGFLMPVPARLDSVDYRLKMDKGDINAVAWDDERQKIVAKPDAQTIVLQVKRVPMTEAESPSLPLAQADLDKLKPYMASSPLIQWDDPDIVKTAKEIAGTEKNGYKVAKKLERFVFENIKTKSYDTGFASAKEVQKNREGDCTEHGVWLAALLRAAGIPSKVAMGLTFAEGNYNYHMWTEAWLGRWVALDATLCCPSVDPAHIEMADSPLEGASMGDKYLAVAQVFGRMKMEVDKALLAGGKAVTTADLKAPGKLDNNKYIDPTLGIAFEVPAGLTLMPRGSKLPNGQDMPLPVAGLLVDRSKGIQAVVVNLPSTFGSDLPTMLKQPALKPQEIKGGQAAIIPQGPARIVMALAPGMLVRVEIMSRNPADAQAVADSVLKTLVLGDPAATPAK